MLSVKDMNNNVHEVCPRCNSEWVLMTSDLVYSCDKCSMIATRHSYNTNEYILSVDFLTDKKLYTVSWYNSYCLIDLEYVEKSPPMESIKLPLLMFNITLPKLQTYILFS